VVGGLTFVSESGGGLWHPESHALNLIRQSIDKHPNRLKSVLTGDDFAAEFFSNPQRKDERSIIQSFVEKNGEDALKTAPKASQPMPYPIIVPAAGAIFRSELAIQARRGQFS